MSLPARPYNIITNRVLPPLLSPAEPSDRHFRKKYCPETRLVEVSRVFGGKERVGYERLAWDRSFYRRNDLCTGMLEIEKNYGQSLFRKYK